LATILVVRAALTAARLVRQLWSSGPSSERRAQWRRAAQACGLQEEPETPALGRPNELTGTVRGLRVSLSGHRQGRLTGTRVAIEGLATPLADLQIRRVGWGRVVGLVDARELDLGDAAFHGEYEVAGGAQARAVLDSATRRLLRVLAPEVEVEVARGRMSAIVVDRYRGVPSLALSRVLPPLVEIASRLVRPADIVERLADNARHEPQAEVRLQCLIALVRECPYDPRTAELLRSALADKSPEIRLRAAVTLGAKGRDTLLALATSEDDVLAATAVVALGEALSVERAKSLLQRAVLTRQMATARACLEALGRIGGDAAVEILSRILWIEQGELATVAVNALIATRRPSAEPALIDALARNLKDLTVAAAEALGQIGSTAAVLPLREALARHPRDGALQRATRQAIRAIQARVSGAAPGQLSLTGGESGQLSLTPEDPSGRLSLDQADEALVGDDDR
jgi:HEAT repeat protein